MITRTFAFFSCSFAVLSLIPSGYSNTAAAAEYYVAPDGLVNGDGSFERPWSLGRALAGGFPIQPGDTIWLRGGVYNAAFRSRLMGAPDLPIVVRGYPGERAVLDGKGIGWQNSALRVEGSWVWFRDFEIMNSNPYTFGHARSGSLNIFAPHSKFINLVIYNTGGGGFWTQAVDSEIYGCLIFSNGHLAADRGHGHGIYLQNDTGEKQIRDNILFNHFGYNFHAFGSSNSRLNNFNLLDNTIFNGQVLAGGNTPAKNIRISGNSFYRSTVAIGYGNPANQDVIFEKNIVASGIDVRYWERALIRNNLFVAVDQTENSPGISLYLRPGGVPTDYEVDGNEYYARAKTGGYDFYYNPGENPRARLFVGWQQLGYDLHGTYLGNTDRPSNNKIILRVNAYDDKRAHLIVYNWLKQDEVEIDLSSLQIRYGEEYEIRNVQNYFVEAISGIYTGEPVKLPMNQWTAGDAVMMYYPSTGEIRPIVRESTFPEFGVFVVTRGRTALSVSGRPTSQGVQRVKSFGKSR
jgi:hypothetical protein